MDERTQTTTTETPKPTKKRGRGRPPGSKGKRPRTEPPKVTDKPPEKPPAEPAADSKQSGCDCCKDHVENVTVEFTGDPERCVVIRIPIQDLSEDGEAYQVTKAGYPRQIRNARLTERQGVALAMIRLGMISRGETLDETKKHFISDGRYEKPIDAKEDVIRRLLEYVADAIEVEAEPEEKK